MLLDKLRSRAGAPQIAALLLLLVFAAQCLWFMAHAPLLATEASYIDSGLLHLERLSNASSPERSPLVPLLAGLAARISGAENRIVRLSDYRFLMRLPFLVAGLLLGASLWYVARRLYGNIGGYLALALFAFSPVMIEWSSHVGPAILGAWGGFGLIFTAIAVAHTLYAPREVVLWNWRRILLLGLSIAICVGAEFSLWVLLIPALAFMLWIGHVRPGAPAWLECPCSGRSTASVQPSLAPHYVTPTGSQLLPTTLDGAPPPLCSTRSFWTTESVCCCC